MQQHLRPQCNQLNALGGVTVFELLCVLALIGIMLTASVMYFSSLSRNQAMAKALQEVKAIVEVGAGYISVNGSYNGFNVDRVVQANLIDARYNQSFTKTGGSPEKWLVLPWSSQANDSPGVGIISGSDFGDEDNWVAAFGKQPQVLGNYFILRFRQTPVWACTALIRQMQTVAMSASSNACNTATTLAQTEYLDFLVPKVIQ